MIPRHLRAWRFVLPIREAVRESAGLQLTDRGGIEMVEKRESVRQAILLLLSTVPGERVMRPDYGCDLRQLVFSPNDDTTAGLAMYYVRRALERWEPRIEVIRLDAERHDGDPYRLNIVLEYRLRPTLGPERMVFPVMLSGERPA